MAETRTQIPERILKDRELGPGVLLLTSPLMLEKTRRFLDLATPARNKVVNWDALLKASAFWSTGERIFVELAFHLWSANELPYLAQPYRWGATLSDPGPVLEAIALAMGLRLE